jgi:carboxypeptidase C (cathepsin A)
MSEEAKEKEEPKKPVEEPKEEIVQTQHTVLISGEEIPYTVTAGTLIVREEVDEKGAQAKAQIFFTAYTRDGAGPGSRPVTFSFNGGPGSSSVWLHLGLLGPRRVEMGDVGKLLSPPYGLIDNDYSLLDVSDLVFIDPVSTGYSRAAPGEKADQFHGFKKDIESVAEFIRLYLTRYGRWSSPKFLIGESYGTTRAAGLAGHLQEKLGIYLNGVMLVSVILNFQTGRFTPGNDLPFILFLPTYTATAWYHRRLEDDLLADLSQALAQAERFARGEYTLALMQGDALPEAEADSLARKLARFTGLSVDYVRRSDLRIGNMRFIKELLRDQRRTTGRLDSRFTGIDRDAAGETFEFDPSMAAIQGPYTAALNDYVRRELKFESDLPYEILTSRVHPWSFKEHENQFLNVAETLRKAMTANPYLRVFVANGFYDLATPYFATEYTFNHIGLDQSLRSNISMSHYEAGHMMYMHQPSLAKLKLDLSDFVGSALPRREV